MTLLLLAVLPSVVALALLIALGVSVVWRTAAGERWQVPLVRAAGESNASSKSTNATELVSPAPLGVLRPVPVPAAS